MTLSLFDIITVHWLCCYGSKLTIIFNCKLPCNLSVVLYFLDSFIFDNYNNGCHAVELNICLLIVNQNVLLEYHYQMLEQFCPLNWPSIQALLTTDSTSHFSNNHISQYVNESRILQGANAFANVSKISIGTVILWVIVSTFSIPTG